MAKKKTGRPKKKLTKKQEAAIIKALGMGLPKNQVCALVDMGDNVFRKYLASHARLSKAYKKAAEKVNETIIGVLSKMAASGRHPGCTIFWAKTRCGFKEKQVIEMDADSLADTAQKILADRMKDTK